MPTLTVKISKTFHSGFSLVEIMVAMFLVALLFLAIPSSDGPKMHRELQGAIDDLDRAVRFAQREAILRNVITRLRFTFDEAKFEYAVEAGPGGQFVLPASEDTSKMNLEQRQAWEKKQKSLENQFNKVEEFSELNRSLSLEVTFYGFASTSTGDFEKSGDGSVYFYPTGEKDEAILVLGTQEELATLTLDAFQENSRADYFPLEFLEGTNLVEQERILQNKIQELYQQWKKP
jgi:prepilin-type N-terminal cleavage/methylation domain-containing protein